jgi:hypothetical protein
MLITYFSSPAAGHAAIMAIAETDTVKDAGIFCILSG